MDHRAISEQILNEHQILAYVTSALRTTLGWQYQDTDLSRKLDSLTFVGQSFQRHLKHLLELEEADGYLAVVTSERPDYGDQVKALRAQHVTFRRGVSRILRELKEVDPHDHEAFAKVTDELLALLAQLDEHHQKENNLLQDALFRDEGGEG